MTECERLVVEGIVPETFYQEEQRETFVPSGLKKLWALQIDMVKQVETICNRHNLKYFAVFGTALGAIRHNGFIPWDDDMDIALKRNDYDLFCKYAVEELPKQYFLQLPTSDPNFYSDHAFLRNSNATCIVKGDEKLKINNGAIIHIMPIDAYTSDKEMKRLYERFKIQHIVAYNNYHFNSYWTKQFLCYKGVKCAPCAHAEAGDEGIGSKPHNQKNCRPRAAAFPESHCISGAIPGQNVADPFMGFFRCNSIYRLRNIV